MLVGKGAYLQKQAARLKRKFKCHLTLHIVVSKLVSGFSGAVSIKSPCSYGFNVRIQSGRFDGGQHFRTMLVRVSAESERSVLFPVLASAMGFSSCSPWFPTRSVMSSSCASDSQRRFLSQSRLTMWWMKRTIFQAKIQIRIRSITTSRNVLGNHGYFLHSGCSRRERRVV